MPTYATPEPTLIDRINAQQLATAGQSLADYGRAQSDFARQQALAQQEAQQYSQRLFMAHQLQAQAAAQQNAVQNQFHAQQNQLAREAQVDAAKALEAGRWQINQENILDRDKLLSETQKQQDKIAAAKQKEADALRDRAKGDVRALNGRLSQLEDAYQSTIAEATPLMDAAIEKAAIAQAARTLGVSGPEFDSIVQNGVTPAVKKKYPTLAGDIDVAKEALRKNREMFAPDHLRVKMNTIQRDATTIRGLYDNALNSYGKLGGVMAELFTENQPSGASPVKERSPLPSTGEAKTSPVDLGFKYSTPAGPAAITANPGSSNFTAFGAPTTGAIGRALASPFLQAFGMGTPVAIANPISVPAPSFAQPDPSQTEMMQLANGQWVKKLPENVGDVYRGMFSNQSPQPSVQAAPQSYPFTSQAAMPEFIQTDSPAAARFGTPQVYPFAPPVVQPLAPQPQQFMQLPDGSIVPRPTPFEDRARYFQQMFPASSGNTNYDNLLRQMRSR